MAEVSAGKGPEAAACYWKGMWQKLNSMRQLWQLCDVSLFADDDSMYMAHSAVLAASSEELHAFFIDDKPGLVTKVGDNKLLIRGMTGDVLQVTLDFIYGVPPKGRTQLEKLLRGAEIMGIQGAARFCKQKLKILERCSQAPPASSKPEESSAELEDLDDLSPLSLDEDFTQLCPIMHGSNFFRSLQFDSGIGADGDSSENTGNTSDSKDSGVDPNRDVNEPQTSATSNGPGRAGEDLLQHTLISPRASNTGCPLLKRSLGELTNVTDRNKSANKTRSSRKSLNGSPSKNLHAPHSTPTPSPDVTGFSSGPSSLSYSELEGSPRAQDTGKPPQNASQADQMQNLKSSFRLDNLGTKTLKSPNIKKARLNSYLQSLYNDKNPDQNLKTPDPCIRSPGPSSSSSSSSSSHACSRQPNNGSMNVDPGVTDSSDFGANIETSSDSSDPDSLVMDLTLNDLTRSTQCPHLLRLKAESDASRASESGKSQDTVTVTRLPAFVNNGMSNHGSTSAESTDGPRGSRQMSSEAKSGKNMAENTTGDTDGGSDFSSLQDAACYQSQPPDSSHYSSSEVSQDSHHAPINLTVDRKCTGNVLAWRGISASKDGAQCGPLPSYSGASCTSVLPASMGFGTASGSPGHFSATSQQEFPPRDPFGSIIAAMPDSDGALHSKTWDLATSLATSALTPVSSIGSDNVNSIRHGSCPQMDRPIFSDHQKSSNAVTVPGQSENFQEAFLSRTGPSGLSSYNQPTDGVAEFTRFPSFYTDCLPCSTAGMTSATRGPVPAVSLSGPSGFENANSSNCIVVKPQEPGTITAMPSDSLRYHSLVPVESASFSVANGNHADPQNNNESTRARFQRHIVPKKRKRAKDTKEASSDMLPNQPMDTTVTVRSVNRPSGGSKSRRNQSQRRPKPMDPSRGPCADKTSNLVRGRGLVPQCSDGIPQHTSVRADQPAHTVNSVPAMVKCKEDGCHFISDTMCTLQQHLLRDHQVTVSLHGRHCEPPLNSSTKSRAKTGYHCADCSSGFDTAVRLQAHQLRVHNKGKLYTCDECTFKSPRRKDVQAHMVAQHNKAPHGVHVYSCVQCGYQCIDKNRAEEHKAKHTGQQRHLCTICGKAYTTRRGMRTHVKYHSAERPHKCEQCAASFKVRSKLRDHIRLLHTHVGHKPFKCSYCGHMTALRGNCNQHIRKHHPGKVIQVIDTLADKRRAVKEYDYADITGQGIEECKDICNQRSSAKVGGGTVAGRDWGQV